VNPKHLKILKKAQDLGQSGKSLESSVAYRAFLDREPGYADVWSDYAGKLLQLGNPVEAQKACTEALNIDPHHLPAQVNLGCARMQENQLEEAEAHFRSVLTADSGRADAQLLLADCLLKTGRLNQAEDVLGKANQFDALKGKHNPLRPFHADLWARLGLALLNVQRYGDAESACATALRLDPSHFAAKGNLGAIWMAQGQLERAEEVLRQVVTMHPQEEGVRIVWITCLMRMGRASHTLEEITTVLRLAPRSFPVHKSVVGTLYALGCWKAYREEIQRFRELAPEHPFLDFEQSNLELLHGDLIEGWKHYEARLSVPEEFGRKHRNFRQPTWRGESFVGKTLLIWAEQGFGDTLMFLRYVPMVKALGGRVIVEAQPPLMDLAATCPGVDVVVPKGAPWVEFDLQVSLLSLAWVFRTELSTIPAEIPYLHIPEKVPNRRAIQDCLAAAKADTRIGLVWAGTPGHGRDAERSIPPATLAPLADIPGVAWFSLQLEKEELPPLPNLVSLAPFLGNFSDTALALCGLDLLITADTAMAHLAGALGLPALLLLSFQPDFRWLLDRFDSPWYPTLRLYRQPTYGDWDSVIKQVITDLTEGL
jgi:tetratricopeptide (TPR) repeat protein